MSLYRSRLSYSIGNEDASTEAQALSLRPTDRVLCITASGDRPLNLLISPCKEIVCLDQNPVQNYLLELKQVAMELLPFSGYAALIGLTPSLHRRGLFARIALQLSPSALQFWHSHFYLIEKGVLMQGFVERFVHFCAKGLNLFQGAMIRELFEIESLEEQRVFLLEKWNGRFLEKSLNLALHPLISRYFIKDPGLFLGHGKFFHPGREIYKKLNDYLHHHLARESLLLSLSLLGKALPSTYTPYLTEEGALQIRPHLDKITIETADLLSYLKKTPDKSFDAFSLSDVPSYCTKEEFASLATEMVRTARPGARFCLRQLLSNHTFPKEVENAIVRNPLLEEKFEREDRCFLYRFFVGSIRN